jgi:hypothetical protein
VVLLVGASNCFAGGDARMGKIQELMKVQGLYEVAEQQRSHCEEQVQVYEDQFMKQVESQFPQHSERLSDDLLVAHKNFITGIRSALPSPEDVAASFGEYYGANLTDQDLDAILAFYKSPAGQKEVQANRLALPKWTRLLAEKHKALFDRALQSYLFEVKSAIAAERDRE